MASQQGDSPPVSQGEGGGIQLILLSEEPLCAPTRVNKKHVPAYRQHKFQFCSKEVKFVCYQLTEEGMKPTKAMLSTIRNFPRPADISGIWG